MKKLTIISSVLFGVIVVAFVMVEYLAKMNTENFEIGKYFYFLKFPFYVVVLIVILFSVKRGSKFKNIFLKYLLSGGFISLFISLLVGFSHAGYHGLINTNYEYEYREFWLNKIEAKELDDTHKMLQKSQLLSKIKASSWVMITWGSALYYFLETFIVSVGASLLVSLLFLLKIKPQKETKLVTDGG